MKINRYPLIEKIIFYPVAFNPLVIIAVVAAFIYVYAWSWWQVTAQPAYFHFKANMNLQL